MMRKKPASKKKYMGGGAASMMKKSAYKSGGSRKVGPTPKKKKSTTKKPAKKMSTLERAADALTLGGVTTLKTMKEGYNKARKGVSKRAKTRSTYKAGGAKNTGLKKPKASQSGLRKLPTSVRNKMGYMKNGGAKKMMKMGGARKKK